MRSFSILLALTANQLVDAQFPTFNSDLDDEDVLIYFPAANNNVPLPGTTGGSGSYATLSFKLNN